MGRNVALLICAALLPYLPILSSSFLMDTHSLLLEAWEKLMMGLESAFTSPIGGGFRPLTSLSVFWTSWWFEGSEIAHRGINYLIHAGTTLVAWRVALRLGLTPGGALVAGVLFALSPYYPLSYLLLFVSGMGMSGFATMQVTIALRSVPPEMRGRAVGAVALGVGASPLG